MTKHPYLTAEFDAVQNAIAIELSEPPDLDDYAREVGREPETAEPIDDELPQAARRMWS